MKNTFLFFLMLPLTLCAQIVEPVKWKITCDENKDNLVVTFTATIDAGWHVYDKNLPEGGPISTQFVIETNDNLTVVGSVQSLQKPTEKFEDMFQMNLRWFEKEVTFQQTFHIENSNNYLIDGYVEYMACDNSNCLPPTKEPFHFEKKKQQNNNANTPSTEKESTATPFSFPIVNTDKTAENTDSDTTILPTTATDTWASVINELQAFGEETHAESGNIWTIFFMGLLGGLLAILTPCVWPIIPMTVSFFLHRKDGKGKSSALLYGLSIIVIYVGLGVLLTILFGADALNALSTNAIFNLFLFALLLAFAISFFGGFNISLPASWSTATEEKADHTKGLLSILMMAFTLVIVSFSCTGPIIGTLLVHIATKGNMLAPIMGMLGFAIALAGPFTLFALFPNMMKKAPRSGSWMNTVKVLLGFFELAFALKFLSVADLAYGWHILDREVFLVLWIVIAILAGLYILGKIRFESDSDLPSITVPRFFGALATFAFALYLIPGLWGAPLKAISAFAPPMWTQDFNLYSETEATFNDYDEAIEHARKTNKPILIDFSGYGCVNCRKMEATVWTDPQVKNLIKDDYILVSLFVDDRTELPEPMTVKENGKTLILKTAGEKWSYLQRHKFGANAQPFYVIIDKDGKPLNHSYAFSEDISKFLTFLKKGLE